MSLSKIPAFCVFCEENRSIYKCPKCKAKYCSLKCFKHPNHNQCSETFYKDWVLSTFQSLKATKSDKEKMMSTLKKVAIENEDLVDENEELSVEDRFADIDLSKDVDEKELWTRLTDEEQKSFKDLLSDDSNLADIIPVVQPWWIQKEITFVKNDEENSNIAIRPPLPIGIKRFSELTTKTPSNTIKYNILNILFCYTCLTRLYNNELRDFIEDAIDAIFMATPVFSQNKNYCSLNEVIQDSLRLITDLHFKLDISFAKSLTYDVCCIINGPTNAHSHYYIICALSDIKSLMLEFKITYKHSETYKNIKQLLLQTVRKIDYFISWCVDYSESNMKPLAKDIQANYYPEIITDIIQESSDKRHESERNNISEKSKVLIEELN